MQLDPQDELVMISGMAPIRARKLRYYEDANFDARRLPAPVIGQGPYPDRPATRTNDWDGQELESSVPAAVEGLLQESDDGRERAPELPEHHARSAPAPQADRTETDRDDGDAGADQRAMDRVRAALARGHALNEGRDRDQDLMPGL
jgi:hypothetical protein